MRVLFSVLLLVLVLGIVLGQRDNGQRRPPNRRPGNFRYRRKYVNLRRHGRLSLASGDSSQDKEGRTEASGTTTTTIVTTATTTEATTGDPSRVGAVEEETLPIINTRCCEPKRLRD